MAEDPLFIGASAGAPSYTATELRRAFAVLITQGGTGDRFGARAGVHPGGSDALSIASFTVTVLALKAVVYPGVTATSGPYLVQIPQKTHTVTAADPTNPRKDIIYLRVRDNDEDASGFRDADTVYLAGTPAGSPAEPSLPAGTVKLCLIDVPASGGGNPVLTYQAPYAVATGGILPVRVSGDLPTTGVYEGMYADQRDTDSLMRWSGAAWETVARAPTAWQTYTPTVTGGGSATFSTNTGKWRYLGPPADKTAFFIAQLVVSVAGSGSSNVTITAPVSMERTLRQIVTGHVEQPSLRVVQAVSLSGGSGATFDRLRWDTGSGTNTLANLIGSDLASGLILTIQGIVREA